MPIYVFECEAGHRFEEFRNLSERDEPAFCQCPNQLPARRVPGQSQTKTPKEKLMDPGVKRPAWY